MAIYSGGIKIRRNICVLAAFLLVIEAVLVTAAIDLLIPQTHFGSNFFPLFFFSFPSPKPITLVPNLFHFSSVYLPLKKFFFSLSHSQNLSSFSKPNNRSSHHHHTSLPPCILTLKTQLRSLFISTHWRRSLIEAPKTTIEGWTKPNAWLMPLIAPTKRGKN